jgi:hypothetical protein
VTNAPFASWCCSQRQLLLLFFFLLAFMAFYKAGTLWARHYNLFKIGTTF